MSMTLIEHIEVGSGGAATITFSSIASSYTDLLLVVSARTDRASATDDLSISINGSTANFSYRQLIGTGSSTLSDTASDSYQAIIDGNSATSNTFGNLQIYIPNYAGSNAKSISTDYVHEQNTSVGYQGIVASLWNQTSAITSIGLDAIGNFRQYSSATLYGITSGSSGGVTVS